MVVAKQVRRHEAPESDFVRGRRPARSSHAPKRRERRPPAYPPIDLYSAKSVGIGKHCVGNAKSSRVSSDPPPPTLAKLVPDCAIPCHLASWHKGIPRLCRGVGTPTDPRRTPPLAPTPSKGVGSWAHPRTGYPATYGSSGRVKPVSLCYSAPPCAAIALASACATCAQYLRTFPGLAGSSARARAVRNRSTRQPAQSAAQSPPSAWRSCPAIR